MFPVNIHNSDIPIIIKNFKKLKREEHQQPQTKTTSYLITLPCLLFCFSELLVQRKYLFYCTSSFLSIAICIFALSFNQYKNSSKAVFHFSRAKPITSLLTVYALSDLIYFLSCKLGAMMTSDLQFCGEYQVNKNEPSRKNSGVQFELRH